MRKHPRWLWPAVAGLVGFVAILFGAVIIYRIATDKGELVVVVETEDPDIEVIVKQGGKQITIIDPQTKKQIELPLQSGKYELKLAGDKPGIKTLDTSSSRSSGAIKTVVTVRREPPEPSETPSDLLSTREQPVLVEVAPFRGHYETIDAVAVSPDGRRLLSGSNDDSLILWDRETAQPIRRLKGHAGDVFTVAISPDGRRALSGGEDQGGPALGPRVGRDDPRVSRT